VAAASGLFKPEFTAGVNRNNQLQPPTSFLIPFSTRTDAVTSTAGLNQRLPMLGTTYSAAWNVVHTDSNSFLTSYNPLVQSGLSFDISQPLVRDRSIDPARQQLITSRINRDIADTNLRETLVHTTADVKSAYWNLVAANANVVARTSALELAQELVRVNKAKVDVGQSPPLDLVSAQAEVAADEEQLIIAQTLVRQTEDRLRVLVFDATDRATWSVHIEPIDSPPPVTAPPDLEAAVTRALSERTDVERARKDMENAQTNVKYTGNQKLPDVRLNARYLASGLGGTQILRTGGFPGTIIGSGQITPYSSVLDQIFSSNYPTWTLGVNVSYPLGQSNAEANFARAKLANSQAEQRLKSTQIQVIQQVRDAAWKIDMNAKRIETTGAALSLAEQRLEAERKRFEVGMSTSFLVIQAQRDLAQARTNRLAAALAYVQALVDFEALQEAGPAGASAAATGSSGAAQTVVAVPPATVSSAAQSASQASTGIAGIVF
jgi:outer membrane protein TolC